MLGDLSRPQQAAAVLAVAGKDVGGIWVRARAGETRRVYVNGLRKAVPDAVRILTEMDDTALFGGVDVSASLSDGRKVLVEGLLMSSRGGLLIGAERASPQLCGRLSAILDAGLGPLIALDEGAEPDEAPARSLTCRLGLFVSLDGIRHANLGMPISDRRASVAQNLYPKVIISAELETKTAEFACYLGIDDHRLAIYARSAAKACAALSNRHIVREEDVELAATLVFAPRSSAIESPPQPESQQPEVEDRQRPSDDTTLSADTELEVDATKVPLPDLLLAATGTAPRFTHGQGSGTPKAGTVRGRPLPSSPGRVSSDRRIDPVATIRAALPWQKLRASPRGQSVSLRPNDVRLKRFETRSQRVIIFAVDASGSQAVARMAEAKGAVEHLLSEAYRSRDEVALLAFRGSEAKVLLPPTRALVRARAHLSALPGGGATPLAAGLVAAHTVASGVRGKGGHPVIVLLSDGKANVPLAGNGDREQAKEDATSTAKAILRSGFETIVLDTARRPQETLAKLAGAMGARYLAMPYATGRSMSSAITETLS